RGRAGRTRRLHRVEVDLRRLLGAPAKGADRHRDVTETGRSRPSRALPSRRDLLTSSRRNRHSGDTVPARSRGYDRRVSTARRVSLTSELHADAQLPYAVFLDLAVERALPELVGDGWATAATSLDVLGEPLLRFRSGRH